MQRDQDWLVKVLKEATEKVGEWPDWKKPVSLRAGSQERSSTQNLGSDEKPETE